MDLNLVLGALALGYGVYSLYARKTSPENFGKLEAMKKQWGDRAGTVVHVIAYTIAPILVGLVLIGRALYAGR